MLGRVNQDPVVDTMHVLHRGEVHQTTRGTITTALFQVVHMQLPLMITWTENCVRSPGALHRKPRDPRDWVDGVSS